MLCLESGNSSSSSSSLRTGRILYLAIKTNTTPSRNQASERTNERRCSKTYQNQKQKKPSTTTTKKKTNVFATFTTLAKEKVSRMPSNRSFSRCDMPLLKGYNISKPIPSKREKKKKSTKLSAI